jgi:outer membrane protein
MRLSLFSTPSFVLTASLMMSLLTGGSALAADSLLAIYERARDSDPEFQQAIADRQAREQALPQAKALLRPSVTLDSTYQTTDSDSTLSGSRSDVEYEQLSYGVSLSQPLYRYARGQGVDQANALVEQACRPRCA